MRPRSSQPQRSDVPSPSATNQHNSPRTHCCLCERRNATLFSVPLPNSVCCALSIDLCVNMTLNKKLVQHLRWYCSDKQWKILELKPGIICAVSQSPRKATNISYWWVFNSLSLVDTIASKTCTVVKLWDACRWRTHLTCWCQNTLITSLVFLHCSHHGHCETNIISPSVGEDDSMTPTWQLKQMTCWTHWHHNHRPY